MVHSFNTSYSSNLNHFHIHVPHVRSKYDKSVNNKSNKKFIRTKLGGDSH